MATLNKVMLIGRLTKNPEEPRVLPNSGSTVVKFRFAVGRSKKNDQGGWDKDPNQLYIDCEVFSRPDSKRNLADLITKYAKQGDMMYLEGRLVFEEWDDKNGGGKRSKHKLVVDSIEFLGGQGRRQVPCIRNQPCHQALPEGIIGSCGKEVVVPQPCRDARALHVWPPRNRFVRRRIDPISHQCTRQQPGRIGAKGAQIPQPTEAVNAGTDHRGAG